MLFACLTPDIAALLTIDCNDHDNQIKGKRLAMAMLLAETWLEPCGSSPHKSIAELIRSLEIMLGVPAEILKLDVAATAP